MVSNPKTLVQNPILLKSCTPSPRIQKSYTPLILVFGLMGNFAFAQLVQMPLPLPEQRASFHGGRTQSLGLPFWEDFSQGESVPNAKRWVNGGVMVSRGMGIAPPSLGVATFDGTGADGKPYSADNVSASQPADSLKSQPIDLSSVPADKQSSVFLSFYYEYWGNGEPPDINDVFQLFFLTNAGVWKNVWTMTNDGTLQRDKFVQILLPLDDPAYFFAGFQFKFQNSARPSGPYDTWHLDYIYLNANRNGADSSVPDRTITSELSPLFGSYYAVPLRHLVEPSMIGAPSFWMYNLRQGNIQPMNFTSWAKITTYKKGKSSDAAFTLEEAKSVGGLEGLNQKQANMALPALSNFDSEADSINMFLTAGLATKDNVPTESNGDYDSKYAPIDFRVNDTLNQSVFLQNYYAYDDGSAEYGASLGMPGARMAYRFDLHKKDTVYAVDIYFPEFGDKSNQVVTLELYADKAGKPGDSPLWSQVITVVRSAHNKFTAFKLDQAIVAEKVFYVGWKQTYAVTVPVGLDKNSNSGDKIFVNANGVWEQNASLQGSLMIRPRFGKASSVVASAEEEASGLYPQPVRENFFLPSDASEIVIADLQGRQTSCVYARRGNKLEVTMQGAQGLYVVSYQSRGKRRAEKFIYIGN